MIRPICSSFDIDDLLQADSALDTLVMVPHGITMR